MTTDDTDALIEKIAHALGKENYVYGPNAQTLFRDDAAAVLPVVQAEVRKAKSEAWDEGCEAFEVAHKCDHIEPWGHLTANPYRDTHCPEEAP